MKFCLNNMNSPWIHSFFLQIFIHKSRCQIDTSIFFFLLLIRFHASCQSIVSWKLVTFHHDLRCWVYYCYETEKNSIVQTIWLTSFWILKVIIIIIIIIILFTDHLVNALLVIRLTCIYDDTWSFSSHKTDQIWLS